jgi:hypothetical protein
MIEIDTLSHGVLLVSKLIIVTFSLLQLFCKALISKHLLLLKYFLRKANFYLNISALVYNTALVSTVIHKEFLVPYKNSFPFLYEAYKPTEKVRLDIIF